MNAHIQDDSPFVLAVLGLVDSDRTAGERSTVPAEVEACAVSQALLLRRATAYLPTLQSSAARDAFCTDHGG